MWAKTPERLVGFSISRNLQSANKRGYLQFGSLGYEASRCRSSSMTRAVLPSTVLSASLALPTQCILPAQTPQGSLMLWPLQRPGSPRREDKVAAASLCETGSGYARYASLNSAVGARRGSSQDFLVAAVITVCALGYTFDVTTLRRGPLKKGTWH